MSSELAVMADPEDASLAGLAAPGGSARAPAAPAPVVALGSADVAGSDVAVRWLDGVAEGGRLSGERLIAPAGEGLWRTAPWPAADALFELERAAGTGAIVVGADPAARETVAERAAARGVAVEPVERLDAGRLAGAACVVFADAPGHALTASTRLATAPPTGALPARAFAVLAARRFLIVPRLEITFGLEDGIDHVQFADPDEAVTFVEAYRRAPDAFARVTAWGRLKAEAQRASVVYGRLADDLRRHADPAVA